MVKDGWSGGAEEERLTRGGGTRPCGVFGGTGGGSSCFVICAGEETSGDSEPEVERKLGLGKSL